MNDNSPNPQPSNAFLQILQTHAGGEVCNELADAMRECVTAVSETGKGATLTITARFLPAAKGAFAVSFSDTKVKVAPPSRPASLWFGDDDGNLSRNDPRQKELPLKTVPAPDPTEAKQVNG